MSNKDTNAVIKEVSLGMGDTLGGSPCRKCDSSYCCEYQKEVGIASTEFDDIMHLVTKEQILRAKHQLTHRGDLHGVEVYRCPFLSEEGQCEIYEERFMICAMYSVVGTNFQCSAENDGKPVAIVNPIGVLETAKQDAHVYARMRHHVLKGEASDVLEEFKKRFTL